MSYGIDLALLRLAVDITSLHVHERKALGISSVQSSC